jgi:hypothetical protein
MAPDLLGLGDTDTPATADRTLDDARLLALFDEA